MGDFKAINFEAWEAKALKDLKTEEAYKKLYHTWNGISVGPYYDSSKVPALAAAFDGHFTTPDPNGASARTWYNLVEIKVTSPKEANGAALKALMNGAEGIHFIIDDTCNIEELMQDIMPEYIYLVFTLAEESMADQLHEWMDQPDIDTENLNLYISLKEDRAELKRYIDLFKSWKGVRFLHFHMGQDSDHPIRDLAEVMLQVSHTFEALSAKGIEPTTISSELVVSAAIGPKFFEEIVRLRALRLLLYKVCRAWNAELEPEDLVIHAISEPWIREDFQPQGNLIKSATAGMAGVLGGANLLTIQPEDPDSELQRRIARNVSIILKEESYLDKTLDPISGAYYIEALTDELARKAWTEFQNKA